MKLELTFYFMKEMDDIYIEYVTIELWIIFRIILNNSKRNFSDTV